MLFYFLGMAAAAAILLISDYRRATNRAAAFFLIVASIGGLEQVLSWLPWQKAPLLGQLLNVTLTPYAVLRFCILYNGSSYASSGRSSYRYLLLIPPAVTILHSLVFLAFAVDYRLTLWWAAPYYLASCWLLVLSTRKEAQRLIRRSRLITAAIMVPTLLAVLGLVYVGRAISPDFSFFPYLAYFFGYSLGLALLASFLYGVLGVKLRLERDPLDTAMQSAASGTAMLNHTIKNEAGKIALSLLNLKHTLGEESQEAADHLRIIEGASEQLLNMAGRLHSQMKEIVLEERPSSLRELVESSLLSHRPALAPRGILLDASIEASPIVQCDPLHVRAVLDNLLHNAAEAVECGGIITISLHESGGDIVLSVADNGHGIPASQVHRVFEPFYTTKGQAANFGLGLSYVYNVMQQSGGRAALVSSENQGTKVSLYFPRRKVVTDERRS